jgi:hypothetical protein
LASVLESKKTVTKTESIGLKPVDTVEIFVELAVELLTYFEEGIIHVMVKKS